MLVPSAVIDRGAGNGDELRRIAAIERQVDDALLVHDLRNRVLLGLHLGDVRLYLHPL